MSREGRRKGPSDEDVLSPNNFLNYVSAAIALLRSGGRRSIVPFVLLGIGLAVALSFLIGVVDDGSTRGLGLAALYIQLLALPLLSSLLVPRVGRMMALSFAGKNVSFREAGRALRGSAPHVFAGGMVAALLTLLLTQALGLLGAFIGWHLAMGPPVFAHVIGLENTSMQEAFARTRDLAKGSALRVSLYLLCAALALVMFETIVSNMLLVALASGVDTSVAEAIFIPLSGAVSGLGLAFMCAMGLVAYLDMRSRTEDFDIDDLRQTGEREPELQELEKPEEEEPEEA